MALALALALVEAFGLELFPLGAPLVFRSWHFSLGKLWKTRAMINGEINGALAAQLLSAGLVAEMAVFQSVPGQAQLGEWPFGRSHGLEPD